MANLNYLLNKANTWSDRIKMIIERKVLNLLFFIYQHDRCVLQRAPSYDFDRIEDDDIVFGNSTESLTLYIVRSAIL